MLRQDVEDRIMKLSANLHTLGIKRVGLFGSTVRGDSRPDSDVDLLIEFADGRKTFDAFMDVADLLESGFPVHVDVLTPESFNSRRRARIEKEVIYYEIGA